MPTHNLVEQKEHVVAELESAMKAITKPVNLGGAIAIPVDHFTDHHYANGAYVRRTFVPKNGCGVGKRHKYECINIVAHGSCRVINVADDKVVGDYFAGDVFVSPAGSKRAIWALEDLVFINCFATDERDLEEFERQFVEEDI